MRNRWQSLVALALALTATASFAADPDESAEEKQTLELLKTFRDEFIPLTPGQDKYPASFTMGRAESGSPAEQPSRIVRMKQSFAIAKYETPQNLWAAVMGDNPSRWPGPRNSVEMLSYDEAVAFCREVTTKMRAAKLIEPNQIVRLPSEAEWEYAARAGTTTLYSFGDDPESLPEFGWFHGNAAGNDPPVGAKKPNAWKLYDVHGYLWEWCSDTWHENYEGAPADGSAWTAGGVKGKRVLRGGSWKDTAESLTSSFRRPADEKLRDDAVGLRCVLSAE